MVTSVRLDQLCLVVDAAVNMQLMVFLLPDPDGGESSALPGGLLQKQPPGGEWPRAAP